jgi:hypothetical protein
MCFLWDMKLIFTRPSVREGARSDFAIIQPFQRDIKIIPSMYITSTRRTNGHCLGTFKTGYIYVVSCPRPEMQCLSLRPYFLSLSLLEGAPHRQTLKISNKNLDLGPKWVLKPRLTGRLTIGGNVTSTLTSVLKELKGLYPPQLYHWLGSDSFPYPLLWASIYTPAAAISSETSVSA